MQETERSQPTLQPYEPPMVSDLADFGDITKGQNSRGQSDDSDAGGYWNN